MATKLTGVAAPRTQSRHVVKGATSDVGLDEPLSPTLSGHSPTNLIPFLAISLYPFPPPLIHSGSLPAFLPVHQVLLFCQRPSDN